MRSRRAAVGASVLYTLCIYRMGNLYTRATLGESLAMIFFPMVLLGLYEVLRRDEKRWPLLALGMTLVIITGGIINGRSGNTNTIKVEYA